MEIGYRKLAVPGVLILAAILVLVLLYPGKSMQSGLGIVPSDSSASVGQEVTLSLQANDLSNVGGVQITIEYDPTILSFVSATEGTYLSANGKIQTLFVQPTQTQQGILQNLLVVRLDGTGTSGSGELAQLTFTPIAKGSTSITIKEFTISDHLGNKITTTTAAAQLNIQ